MAGENVGRVAAYRVFDTRQEAEERSTFGVVSTNAAAPPIGGELLDQINAALLDQGGAAILEQ